MAITKSVVMRGVSGHIGGDVVFRQRGDKTIVCAFPAKSKKKRTEKQLEIMRRMEAANRYALYIINNIQLRHEAQVRLNVTRNKLYTALVKEFFQNHKEIDKNPPKVIPSATEANTQFVTYLLQNTDKTIQEMAALARVPVEFVEMVKSSIG
ncbi:MAG: hypothetical protein J7497_02685 [Chitinophagaceae bacterium]|nr:hypothetical protein [Chitinophagaceae bacterium]